MSPSWQQLVEQFGQEGRPWDFPLRLHAQWRRDPDVEWIKSSLQNRENMALVRMLLLQVERAPLEILSELVELAATHSEWREVLWRVYGDSTVALARELARRPDLEHLALEGNRYGRIQARRVFARVEHPQARAVLRRLLVDVAPFEVEGELEARRRRLDEMPSCLHDPWTRVVDSPGHLRTAGWFTHQCAWKESMQAVIWAQGCLSDELFFPFAVAVLRGADPIFPLPKAIAAQLVERAIRENSLELAEVIVKYGDAISFREAVVASQPIPFHCLGALPPFELGEIPELSLPELRLKGAAECVMVFAADGRLQGFSGQPLGTIDRMPELSQVSETFATVLTDVNPRGPVIVSQLVTALFIPYRQSVVVLCRRFRKNGPYRLEDAAALP